ncbi:MAG TPA: mercuric transporter MerT family protein, partial [Flavisolibacter sp.]|nr:mercuric transporter MerT family protein [Flavisolibacter sp.]
MSKGSALLSLVSAIGASLCCIAPVLALLSGASGIASRLVWIEPARPYLICLAVLLLAFAWYQKLRVRQKDNCGCAVPKKRSFLPSTLFLGLMTGISVLVLTFPLYARVFYP